MYCNLNAFCTTGSPAQVEQGTKAPLPTPSEPLSASTVWGTTTTTTTISPIKSMPQMPQSPNPITIMPLGALGPMGPCGPPPVVVPRRVLHPPLLTPIEVDGHRLRDFGPEDPRTRARDPGTGSGRHWGPGTKMGLLPNLFFRKNTKSSITGLGSGFWKNAEDHKNGGARPPDPASIVG